MTVRIERIPTVEEFAAYTGGHTHKLWRSLHPGWVCPSCQRSRYEVLTWTKRKRDKTVVPVRIVEDYHWLVAICPHHDHRADGTTHPPRFPRTLVCGDCNTAEGQMVKKLGLTGNFSFSPEEMRLFITGKPHGRVVADHIRAKAIYERLFFFF
jgi:hypothetical protein